jgi:SAM-dependent methyltransferase
MTDVTANDCRRPVGAGSSHVLAGLVDHTESYGPHIVKRFARSLDQVRIVVDLGAGTGRDLSIIKVQHPEARRVAVECASQFAEGLHGIADEIHILDLERDALPFPDGSVDVIIANQVLEHMKEVFWVFDQVTRSLRVGGSFIFGTPNVASLHNRIALLLFGRQPSQHKLCSAHVRPFSRADTLLFLEECFADGYRLEGFAGAQFYPFPRRMARFLAALAPSMAYSIFFHIRKTRAYHGEFLDYPSRAGLQTNFWTGKTPT